MKGEFRGDFSRDTFDPSRHFLRVLMQQGRVSLDADWNEQTDILLHYMQTLAEDLIGPFAGPEDPDKRGFAITATASTKSFTIGRGRYYVDGILCENEPDDLGYYDQPDFPRDAKDGDFQDNELPLLVYLDVWERHISFIEDDYIREKALGAADTASRSKVVWQVKALKLASDGILSKFIKISRAKTPCESIRQNWRGIVENLLQNPHRGCLRAKAKETEEVPKDPCITPPESRYRGEENQLYRVEVHQSGFARNQKDNSEQSATFKWSRDNGTVAFPIIFKLGNKVMLEHLGRDDRLSLKKDDWVEVLDDDYTLQILSRPSPLSKARPLVQIDNVDRTEMTVTLRLQDSSKLPDYAEDDPKIHPLLRRWDHERGDPAEQDEPVLAEDDGALYVDEGKWLTLEDGVQILFESSESVQSYQRGDFWLIPARTAIGDVEWPKDSEGAASALPPRGIDHHYAPLAVIDKDSSEKDNWVVQEDCRCSIVRALSCGSVAKEKKAR